MLLIVKEIMRLFWIWDKWTFFIWSLYGWLVFKSVIYRNNIEIIIDKVLAEKFNLNKLFNFEKKLKKLKKILEKIKNFSKIIIRKFIWRTYRVYIFYKTKNYNVIKDIYLQSVGNKIKYNWRI